MTRAPERPKTTDPAVEHDPVWEDEHGGETPDSATAQALNLAHRAAEKFPDLANRYKKYAGPAAVASGALIALAGVAVARRAKRGQNADEILEQITSDEIENAAKVTNRRGRVWRMVQRIARKRYGEPPAR